MKEKKEMHQQISKLTDTIQRLELRHKKMHQVVSNLGFDEDDYQDEESAEEKKNGQENTE